MHLLGRPLTERAVGATSMVVDLPRFDEQLGIGQACEPVDIEALVAKTAVEALDEGILNGLTGIDELQLDLVLVGPLIESDDEHRDRTNYSRAGFAVPPHEAMRIVLLSKHLRPEVLRPPASSFSAS